MADRSRRVRRQISDATDDPSEDTDSGSGEDYDPRRSDSMRRAGRHDSSAASTPPTNRSRRAAPAQPNATGVQRSLAVTGAAADDRRQSLTFTVKAPPSKLREVIRANEIDSLHDTLGGGTVLDGPRRGRRTAAAAAPRSSGRAADNRPRYAEYGESDIDEDEDEDEEDDEEEEEEELNDFDELGAEAEGGTDEEDEEEDEEEDVEMEDLPPSKQHAAPKPPKITLRPPAKTDPHSTTKPKLIVTPAKMGPVQSVEDKEMEDDPGDDEVDNSSELSDEDEDATNLNGEDAEGEDEEEVEVEEEDAQGEDEEMEDEEDEEDDDDEEDDTDETPASGMATPDPNKQTKRQRGRPEDQGGLMALDMAPQQRKFFTDAEKAMKKDEHARKRKELTKRKVQEEKTAALNRLLKPQASKARGAAPKPETLASMTAIAGLAVDDDELYEKANPLYTRWVSTKDGVQLGVPEEWLDRRVGTMYRSPLPASNTPLVQEVE